jgi:tetratricopeptide (TPR) repeat protein
MNSKYAFLRSKIAFIILGLIAGLFTGFKIANSQYRREQNRALASAARGSRGSGADHAAADVQAVMERARANPNDADAQMEAASQFIQIERPDEAMPFLEQANKAKPDDPRILAGLGVAHFMRNDLEQAATYLKRSRDRGATEPTVTSLLVGAYIQQGKNLDEADRLLKELEAKGLDPTKLSQIRADLNAARSGSGGAPKTMLNHGPENKTPAERR